MGLFKRKRKQAAEEPTPIGEKPSVTWYLRVMSTDGHGHIDFKLTSPNENQFKGLYEEIKQNIGHDYILEFASHVIDGEIYSKSAINLKSYAYVSFGKYEDEE